MALLLGVWALFGFADLGKRSYGGFELDPAYVVADVATEGPADQAGLVLGDKVLSIDGISTDDPSAVRRRPPPEVRAQLFRCGRPAVDPTYLPGLYHQWGPIPDGHSSPATAAPASR